MRENRVLLRYGLPAGVAVALLSGWATSHAQQATERLDVVRLGAADGRHAVRIELEAVSKFHASAEKQTRKAIEAVGRRADDQKTSSYTAVLPGCRRGAERLVDLAQAVPERLRALDLFLFTVPRGGARPRSLPERLPENAELFVLAAESLDDVAAISRRLDRRLTLAGGDFARAIGVACADAHVTFSRDGRTATVREVAP